MNCFIIVNKRSEYFALERIRNEVGTEVSFHAILLQERLLSFPPSFLESLDSVYPIPAFTDSHCRSVIDQACQGKGVRIVATDEALLPLAARLRAHYRAPGAQPHEYVGFASKRVMKQVLQAAEMAVPSYLDYNPRDTGKNLPAYHRFLTRTVGTPYIVKPIVGGSSANTARIETVEQLETYHKEQGPEADCDVEAFIDGEMLFCDSYVVDGEVRFEAISQYLYPCLEFCHGCPLGAFPIDESHPLYKRLSAFNQAALAALSPPDGGVHLEVMVREGEIVFIEVGPRPPGNRVVAFHEKNYGINMYELTLRQAIGLPLSFDQTRDFYHSWVSLSTIPGIVERLPELPLEGKHTIRWLVNEGQTIASLPKSINEGASAELSLYHPDSSSLMRDMEALKTFRLPIS